MVYGAEAVLPHDLKFCAPRISGYEEEEAEEALQDDKDLTDEARDTTLARSKGYQDKLRTYQSSRLRTRTFSKGDLVMRVIQEKSAQTCPAMGRTIHSLGGHRRRRIQTEQPEDIQR